MSAIFGTITFGSSIYSSGQDDKRRRVSIVLSSSISPALSQRVAFMQSIQSTRSFSPSFSQRAFFTSLILSVLSVNASQSNKVSLLQRFSVNASFSVTAVAFKKLFYALSKSVRIVKDSGSMVNKSVITLVSKIKRL